MKIKVLKYHSKNAEAKSSLWLARANQLLTEWFSNIATDANRNEDGVPPLPPVFEDVEDGSTNVSSGLGSADWCWHFRAIVSESGGFRWKDMFDSSSWYSTCFLSILMCVPYKTKLGPILLNFLKVAPNLLDANMANLNQLNKDHNCSSIKRLRSSFSRDHLSMQTYVFVTKFQLSLSWVNWSINTVKLTANVQGTIMGSNP